MVFKLLVAAYPFHCTQIPCGLSFCQSFSIIGNLDRAVSLHEYLNRLGNKRISGFGLLPIDVTKIK